MACFESGGKERDDKKSKWPLEAEDDNQKGKSNPVPGGRKELNCQLPERARRRLLLWPPEKRTLLLTPSFQPVKPRAENQLSQAVPLK